MDNDQVSYYMKDEENTNYYGVYDVISFYNMLVFNLSFVDNEKIVSDNKDGLVITNFD